jgi:predicted Rossmann fold flavoprotein
LALDLDRLPIVVIGAGAAGMTAAIFAAEQGRPTLLLERTRDGGRKILISGGGRCNVLPSQMDPGQYFTASSRNSLKKILLSWPLDDQRRWFEEVVGIPLALEAESGKLFPESNKARDVRDALLDLARRRGARLRFDSYAVGLEPPGAEGEPWRVRMEGGQAIEAAAVVIATGGLSVPQTGSDGTGLRIVKQLGHTLNETYAALTPLTSQPAAHGHLAGVSLTAHLEAPLERGSLEASGGFLFTHRGYSGPSVLNVSHAAVRAKNASAQPVFARWTEMDAAAWERLLLERSGGTVLGLLRRHLATRLADTLLDECGVDEARTLPQLRRDERARLVEALTRYRLPWTGDEGYKKAEVTGGGVPLGEVDPRTLESRVVPGLFLCGEILDCFGPIGGYNFCWAWATGRAAGLGAAGRNGST